MFADSTRAALWPQLARRDFRVFAHLLTPALVTRAARAAGCALGRGPLNLLTLVWLSLACAWHRGRSFADVLGLTLKLLRDLADGPEPAPRLPRRGNHDPRVDDPTQLSADAFTQARARLPWGFWLALTALLADDFAQTQQPLLRWRGRYRLLCLDGTTINLPNWPAVRSYFGSAGRGQGQRQAQARLVMVQLTNARLPWRYDLTPLAQCEQEVADRLLADLQANDLVLMDRGFFTYALFWRVQERHAFFATRLRKQVKLKTLRPLGPGDQLVEWWPRSSAAKQAIRERQLPACITLRVITYQVAGFRPSAVVTNLLDAGAVPAAELVRLEAREEGRRLEAGLYHKRWQIETSFLELKVTQGLEGSLRSRVPAGIRFEVAGHLLLYQLLRWLLVEAAQAAGLDDPLRLSYQEALEELEDLRPAMFRSGPGKIKRLWRPKLLLRLAGHQVPWRPNRHYRRPHDSKAKAKGGGRYQPASKLEAGSEPKGSDTAPAPKPRE
jgi:Transposase DDE domain